MDLEINFFCIPKNALKCIVKKVSGQVEMVGQDVSLLSEIKDIEGTKNDPLETSSSASVQDVFDNQAELPVWGMALIGALTAGVVRNVF